MQQVRRLETLAKAGFLARGILYLLLGYFAAVTGGGEGAAGILERIEDAPAGSMLLVIMSLGLIGYGIFRLFSAWLNLDGKKADARGKLERAGQALSGVVHLLLAVLALQLALGSGGGTGRAGGSPEAIESLPGGWMLLAIGGGLMIVGGLGNLLEAWAAKFRKLLSSGAPAWAEHAGRVGYAARGAVFLIVGWQLISAAFGSASQQVGTESALEGLRGHALLFYSVAFGLAMFGAFNLLLAAWAKIKDEDVLDRLKAATRTNLRR
jgi:hypothetical protein